MLSSTPQFEYDIFISYRHNDDLDGWVTDFVHDLEKELRSTLKETVTIYFDKNPRDGLLETDSVDKSLEGKLNCLIFIPVISQTYCDTRSYAWQHEFCRFNIQAAASEAGRDIRLNNGNVAGRILPVRIHDLDAEDKAILEAELGGPLRAIEFIYREPGVNRPLKLTDNKNDNQNKTDYRNQVNKVANAIKQIVAAVRHPASTPDLPAAGKSQGGVAKRFRATPIVIAVVLMALSAIAYFLYSRSSIHSDPVGNKKSIAVLSFVDMSPNRDQEYLGDGIAEDILNALTKVKGLKVIGRTSSFSFKGKDTDLKTIGEVLGAATILEGSVQKSGNRIKITVQLINAGDETHIWSERYEREVDDIFAIQDDIATRIIQKLKGSLAVDEHRESVRTPTADLQAYEMFLRARHFRLKGIEGLEKALEYARQAITLEPTFARAYSEMSLIYWHIALYGLADQRELNIKARDAALKAIALDSTSYEAYNMLAYLDLTVDWNIPAYLENYSKAVSLGLPLPDPWHGNYEQWILLDHEKVAKEAELLVENDPLSVEALVNLSRVYLYARRYEDVIRVGNKTLELSPDHGSIFRHMGEAYLFMNKPEAALPFFERLMEKNPGYCPYNFVAVNVKLGNSRKAREKFNALKGSMSPAKKAVCYIYLGKTDSAFMAIDEACRTKDTNIFGAGADHHFDLIRSDPRFRKVMELTTGR